MKTLKNNKFVNKTGITFFLSTLISSYALSAVPTLQTIDDQRVIQGETYSYQPELDVTERVYWTKTYGPDSVVVHPRTGKVSWDIPADMPGESYHLGIKASNGDGSDEETWIVTVGNGNLLYIGPDETYKTLKDGMKNIASGDTLVMRNGDWVHNSLANTIPGNPYKTQTLPAGTSQAYTNLMAEDPGKVVIDGQNQAQLISLWGSEKHPDWPLNNNNSTIDTDYLTIKGLVLINSDNEALRVNNSKYIKLINIGIGPSSIDHGAYANVYIYRSQYVLIEGMYVWGHGRYKIQLKNSSESIVRRSIARIDDYIGGEPIGGFISYCSRNILFQNNILIDSDQSNYWGNHNEIINAFGVPATNCEAYPEFNEFKRNIALNIHMGLMNTDARQNVNPTLWEDLVGWDLKPNRHSGGTGSVVPILSGVGATVTNRMTLGEVETEGNYFMYSREKDSTVKNSIFHRVGWDGTEVVDQGALVRRGSGGQFYFSNNNLEDFMGDLTDSGGVGAPIVSNTLSLSPEIQYMTMLPRNSALRDSGVDNDRVGAEVMTMLGASGTLYGDSGYDSETGIPMWPFPNQDLAHKYFGSFSLTGVDREGGSAGIEGARGFAVEDQTMSNYIWTYLGAPVPPFGVSGLAGHEQVKLLWNASAPISQSQITAYNVYQVVDGTATLLTSVAANVYDYTVKGLVNDESVQFAVTAVRSDDVESDYAYATLNTPEIKPAHLPPVLTID